METKVSKIKPYIRCVVFIMGIVVLIGVCDFCFAQTGYINYVFRHIKSDEVDYDTIVIGASHARGAIDPNVMDEITGDDTMNMAIPGASMKDAFYVMKESVRGNKIDKVILDVDYQYWYGPQEQGYFSEASIYNQMSWLSPVKWQYLSDNMQYLDIRNAISQRNVYKCSLSSIKKNIKQKLSKDYKNANIYSLKVKDAHGPYKGKGFFYRDSMEGAPLGEGYILNWIGREKDGMNSYPVKYFKRIKNYCDKNGIELICVTSPIPPSNLKRLGMDVVDEEFNKFFDEQGVAYYNFNKARLDVIERTDNDFADQEGHMEGPLAERYSRVLGDVLKEHEEGTIDKTDYFYSTFDELYEVIGE